MEQTKPNLFEKCGYCGREILKNAAFEVYAYHYNTECQNAR